MNQDSHTEVLVQQVSTDSKNLVDSDISRVLLHDSIVANGKIPQASYAQSIMLADDMIGFVRSGKATWESLEEVSLDITQLSEMDQRKIKAHAAFGFKTTPSGELTLQEFWKADKFYALQFISELCKLAYKAQSGHIFFGPDRKLIDEVFSHPEIYSVDGLAAMVHEARKELMAEDIQQRIDLYRDTLAAVMRKYKDYTFETRPDDYKVDIENVNKEKDEILDSILERVKVAMEKVAPDTIKQLLVAMTSEKFFERIPRGFISPLKAPRNDLEGEPI